MSGSSSIISALRGVVSGSLPGMSARLESSMGGISVLRLWRRHCGRVRLRAQTRATDILECFFGLRAQQQIERDALDGARGRRGALRLNRAGRGAPGILEGRHADTQPAVGG